MRSELASLNSDLEAKVEAYNYALYQLENIGQRIDENKSELAQVSGTLKQSQSRLEKRLVSIYRNGSADVLDVLMETSDINEFMSAYDMMEKVGQQDKDDLEQVKMLKEQVEEAQAQLEKDQNEQSALVDQVAAEQADIETGIAERQQTLSGLDSQIATLQEQAARQEAFDASMASSNRPDTDDSALEEDGPAPPSTAGGAVGIAMQYLGVPYVWGGASPSGFDCSGLVMYVYEQLGISLPHSAAAQFGAGTPVSYDELEPGDLVFFGDGGISHVGIYIGGGSMIHAPFEGEVVQIAPVSGGGSYRGAARL